MSVAARAHVVIGFFHLCLYNISLATRPGYGLDGLHQHNKCVLCQSLPVSCDYPVSHVLSSFPKLCTGITPERMGNKMRNVRMCEFFFLKQTVRVVRTMYQSLQLHVSQWADKNGYRHPDWFISHNKWSVFAWLLADLHPFVDSQFVESRLVD